MSNELVPLGTREITEAQQQIFTQKTPKNKIKTRPGPGGKRLSYVEHGWVTAQLNLAFNWAWSWRILEWKVVPSVEEAAEVFVLGQLTVHTPNGDLVKSQFGAADVKRTKQGIVISLGDDLKAASSDALKKCASLLGLALDLYTSDDDRHKQPSQKKSTKRQAPGAHVASQETPTTITELYTMALSELKISSGDAAAILVDWLKENHATSSIGGYAKDPKAIATLWEVLKKKSLA